MIKKMQLYHHLKKKKKNPENNNTITLLSFPSSTGSNKSRTLTNLYNKENISEGDHKTSDIITNWTLNNAFYNDPL